VCVCVCVCVCCMNVRVGMGHLAAGLKCTATPLPGGGHEWDIAAAHWHRPRHSPPAVAVGITPCVGVTAALWCGVFSVLATSKSPAAHHSPSDVCCQHPPCWQRCTHQRNRPPCCPPPLPHIAPCDKTRR